MQNACHATLDTSLMPAQKRFSKLTTGDAVGVAVGVRDGGGVGGVGSTGDGVGAVEGVRDGDEVGDAVGCSGQKPSPV